MQRPKNVLTEATWDKHHKEWFLGKKNKDDEYIGNCSFWFQDGYLYAEKEYDDEGYHIASNFFPPESVPKNATWYSHDYQWGVGKTKEIMKVGKWRYYLQNGIHYLTVKYDNDSDIISEKYIKPSHIPKEATWNEDDLEWELGEKNNDDDEIGEWKWWLAPTGHLCCHSFFDDEGNY